MFGQISRVIYRVDVTRHISQPRFCRLFAAPSTMPWLCQFTCALSVPLATLERFIIVELAIAGSRNLTLAASRVNEIKFAAIRVYVNFDFSDEERVFEAKEACTEPYFQYPGFFEAADASGQVRVLFMHKKVQHKNRKRFREGPLGGRDEADGQRIDRMTAIYSNKSRKCSVFSSTTRFFLLKNCITQCSRSAALQESCVVLHVSAAIFFVVELAFTTLT